MHPDTRETPMDDDATRADEDGRPQQAPLGRMLANPRRVRRA